ncbi:MAG: sulfite exporter TauE/SafE family protein [Acidobacteriota bacterium]
MVHIAAITLIAAIVNGALGYGFSSITVPFALLFLTNRVLTPALVPVEVVLNAWVVWVNRRSLPRVAGRVLPVILGLVPGVIAGTYFIATANPAWLKFWTFVVLLPLILLQAAGFRRPIRSERPAGVALGGGVGLLYAVTTISGPPLAAMLTNQGLAKEEFRAAIGLIRLAESSMTALAYWQVGLYSAASFALMPQIVPSLILGVPIGAWLIRRIQPETFRRVCMSFDAWVVAFGIATVLRSLGLVEGPEAFLIPAAALAVDGWLLRRFFTGHRPLPVALTGSLAQ